MAVTCASASWTVSLTRPDRPPQSRRPGRVCYRGVVGGAPGSGCLAGLARRSRRAWASCRRSRLFSSASLRLRSLVSASRRSRDASVARWLAGIAGAGARWVVSRRRWIWSRMSAWAYSHERETPAAPAMAAKVTGVPAWSSSRRARMALARVSSWRRRAAPMSGAVLSGRIGCCLWLGAVAALERCDDLSEVAGDLTVHLGQAVLAAGFGGGDDLQDLLTVGAVLGQELGGGDEHRAGQARVRMRAAAYGWQPAVAIGQGLGGPG